MSLRKCGACGREARKLSRALVLGGARKKADGVLRVARLVCPTCATSGVLVVAQSVAPAPAKPAVDGREIVREAIRLLEGRAKIARGVLGGMEGLEVAAGLGRADGMVDAADTLKRLLSQREGKG